MNVRQQGRDPSSVDERLGLLLMVRIGIVATVVLAGLAATTPFGVDLARLGPVSACYLVLAVAVESFQRGGRRGHLWLHRSMLLLDAVYLVIVTAPAGGPRSELVFLFSVHLIAVTLLASRRTGIRIAAWDSLLFVLIPALSLPSHITDLLGAGHVADPSAAESALAIVGFCMVAMCTAFFSSVNERELRRSKTELGALAEMATDLEAVHERDKILAVLLRAVIRAFRFEGGAVVWSAAERPQDRLTVSCLTLSAGGALTERAAFGDRPLDELITTVWNSRQPASVPGIDARTSPLLAGLLPNAVNLVALPLAVEDGKPGALILVAGGSRWAQLLPRRTLVMLGQYTAHVTLALRSASLLAEREHLAAVDGLTGLVNRREFDRTLGREVSRSQRTGDTLSLVVLDVDCFKQVNDIRGHLAGDDVLRALSRVLESGVREMDSVARYGGEEFALILPNCESGDAVRVVQRITDAVATEPVLEGITLSSGLATMPANASDGRSLLAAADEALYCSKRQGRNRLTMSSRNANGLATTTAPGPERVLTIKSLLPTGRSGFSGGESCVPCFEDRNVAP